MLGDEASQETEGGYKEIRRNRSSRRCEAGRTREGKMRGGEMPFSTSAEDDGHIAWQRPGSLHLSFLTTQYFAKLVSPGCLYTSSV